MRKIPLRYLPLTGIILLFITIGFFLIKSNSDKIAETLLDEIMPEEGITLKNASINLVDPDDGSTIILDAEKVTHLKDEINFSSFRIVIEPDNKLRVRLEGNNGKYYRETGELDLYGELKGETDSGYKIFTEHILYKQKVNSIVTDEPVELAGPYFTLTGKGLHYDLKNEILQVLSDVHSRIKKESLNL